MSKQALDGKRLNAFGMDPMALTVVGYDTDDGPDHPLWDERINLPIEEAMVLNIMAIGVKETVTVRKNGDEVEVVDGRRRVLHARVANERLKERGDEPLLVPCMPMRGSDELVETCLVSLNEIRLQDDMTTKVKKAERMFQRNGGDIGKIAVAFGVTTTQVRNWLKVAELSEPVQKAISEGKVSPTAALKLHGKTAAQQKEAIKKAIESKPEKKKRVSAKSLEEPKEKAPLKERLVDAHKAGKGIRLDDADVCELVAIMRARWNLED